MSSALSWVWSERGLRRVAGGVGAAVGLEGYPELFQDAGVTLLEGGWVAWVFDEVITAHVNKLAGCGEAMPIGRDVRRRYFVLGA